MSINRSGNERGKYVRSEFKDITKIRKQQIVDFVREFVQSHKYSPTYKEIAVGIGYKVESDGTIYPYIRDLIKEGWLKKLHSGARSLVMVEPSPAPYYYRREDAIRERMEHNRPNKPNKP